MVRVYTIKNQKNIPLDRDWELLSVAPGAYVDPEELVREERVWLPAIVPGTVSATLQQKPREYCQSESVDGLDWWYRCSFPAPTLLEPEDDRQFVLVFAGLATVADVWLNGQHILHSDNMFRAYEVDVTALLQRNNTLAIRFLSLDALLAQKRPRPRWRTQLIDSQQLRWFRTTLLGRIPGWSSSQHPVGPWQAVRLEERRRLSVQRVDLRATLEGKRGALSVSVTARRIGEQKPEQVALVLDGLYFPLAIEQQLDGSLLFRGEASLADVRAWWPYTHGEQPLYPVEIVIQYAEGRVELDCGCVAFRRIELLDETGADFGLRVNGVPIFCRGACWTPLNVTTLVGTESEYRDSLLLAKRAGMNMLRVGGTMVYETDAFYDLCDQLGILIWQDFMFANMDYPIMHEEFLTTVHEECEQVLQRLQGHPCLAVLCGNSEVEQQVAMLGLSPEIGRSDYFSKVLPSLCRAYIDVPYWPSTPSGGVLPFQANVGTAHYQSVGAYLKPLEDARRSEVRFATECLAFAHVPEDRTIDLFMKPGEQPVHHPQWKSRVPRDNAVGWDFEDVRDYYLERLFSVEPMKLRYSDMQRYLALSRVVSGEVIASVLAEWRRAGSTCHGALLWFYRDLLPGAGWGVLDATGYPKAAYYYLRRVSQPQACFFTDESGNGLLLHVVNDTQLVLSSEVQIALYHASGALMETRTKAISVPAQSQQALSADALFEHFLDLTYAYRFGPPAHTLAVATLLEQQTRQVVSEAFYFPHGLSAEREADIGLKASVSAGEQGTYFLHLSTEKFAQSVSIHLEHFIAEDNYFHMRPCSEKTVLLSPLNDGKKHALYGSVSALNTHNEVSVYE